MAALISYLRVSTDIQQASPDVQQNEIQQWATSNGHEIVRVFHEIPISGKTVVERRVALPELMKLVATKPRNFDGIIVWAIDRLARDNYTYYSILKDLDKHKCALYSVKDGGLLKRDTASDRMMAGMYMLMAAAERERIGERIFARHLREFQKGGVYGGQPPFGYKWNKETRVFEPSDRADDVIRIFELFIKYNGRVMDVTKELNLEGIPSQRGQLWSRFVIQRMMRNPFYRRRYSFKEFEIDGSHLIPEVVPPELLRRADGLLKATQSIPAAAMKGKYCYSGLIYCLECRKRFRVESRPIEGSDKRRVHWHCSNHFMTGMCTKAMISQHNLDAMIGVAILRLLELNKESLKGRTVAKKRKPVISNRDKLEAERVRIVNMHIKGHIAESDMEERLRVIDEELLSVEVETEPSGISREVADMVATIAEKWENISGEVKRKLLLTINARVYCKVEKPEMTIVLESDACDTPILVEATSRWRWPPIIHV